MATRPGWVNDELSPFESHLADVGGAQVHYIDEDQGPVGYGYTIAEDARVVEGFVEQLDLREVTLMVQDWGGPIGLWVATRHPERFRAFVIGNTWAWPISSDRPVEWFSKTLGSAGPGGLLVKRADIFTNVFMRGGIRRKKLTVNGRFMYKRPHPTPDDLLTEVEDGSVRVADKPALIVWGTRTRHSASRSGFAGSALSPTSGQRFSTAPPITSRMTHPTR